MSDATLQAYMEDDPNLSTQPTGTENSANGALHDGTLPGYNNTEDIAGRTNATPGPAAPAVDEREDVDMTTGEEQPGEAATGIGTLFRRGALLPTTWFAPRSDSESRKRKERSPSPLSATDGGDQSTDTAGAHKKLRAITSTSGSPPQGAESGAVDRRDSATRPSRSGSEAIEQSSGAQSMPGALSLTNMGLSSSKSMVSVDQSVTLTGTGAHFTGNKASVSATSSLTTGGPSAALSTGLVVSNSTSASDVSRTGSTSAVIGSSGGHGPPATTTTPPSSPPRTTADTGPSRPPVKDKTTSRDEPPSIDPLFKGLPITGPGTPAVHGPSSQASTGGFKPPPVVPVTSSAGPSSASSSTTPNNPDPWLVLAQKFDGVRTEIQTMGSHMRTMNNNISRLDNAVGVMADQHTELMSVLRVAFQPFNPPPPTGQSPTPTGTGRPPLVPAPPAAGPHSAVVPAVPIAHHPPGPTLPRSAATRQQPRPTASSHSTTQSGHRAPPPSSSSRKNSSRPQPSSDDEMDVDGGELGDTEREIPEPLPVVVKSSKLKLKGMPRPCNPVRKALLDDIKLMARKYMGRELDPDDDDDGDEDCDVPFFDDAKVPSRDEVRAFDGRGEHCCTIDNFRPDLLGTPRSTWNQSATQVFAKEYIKTATAKSKNATEVARAFGDHMKTLINSYKTYQASDTTNDAKRRKRRRYMRKSYAHQRRMMTVASHAGMKRHLWIIQALGVQGMSSDESEHEGTQVRYRRTTLAWRNPALEAFFHVIDVFHDANRFTNGVDKSSKSGSHVHLRLPARKTSERAAVPGLPEAAYNPAWLKDLSDFFRNRLNISTVQYEFAHPPEVLKEMVQVLRPTPADQTQQIPLPPV